MKPRVVLLLALALSFVLQARIVFTDDGINWPDEIYQSFEPAHRLVFGYGLVAWEFAEGARTWAVPGFVSVWLFLCKLVGADAPQVTIRVVKLVFVLLSLLTAVGVTRLSKKLGGSEWGAALAGAAWSLCALALYFSARAMSEDLAAPLVVWGLSFLVDAEASRRDRLWGAALLSLATIVRLQMAVFCVVALLIPLVRRQGRRAVLELGGALAVGALAYGLFDAAAWHDLPNAKWGGLFHSVVVYWRFNIVENRGAGWGTAPWTYFFVFLFKTMPAMSLVVLASVLATARRAWVPWASALLFFALHLYVAHKELRFVVPLMPVLFATIGLMAVKWPGRGPVFWAGVVGIAAMVSVVRHSSLEMGDVGSYLERPRSSAWDDFGNVNRLLRAAGQRADLCGLLNAAVQPAWTGGYTYLHRNVPYYAPRLPPPTRQAFNYVIAGGNAGGEVVAREGNLALLKVADTCTPDPAYSWKLP